MGNFLRISAALACAAVAMGNIPKTAFADKEETNVRSVVIDGANANTAENMLYRGNGMVSGNNSSRLLLDYKAESPEAYREILEYLFGESGLHISHLKVEMGADINSSSGTEPSVKRYEDEKTDVTRGAAYQLAADAKEVNPDLTLDMLWWSEPKWVSGSDDVYAARYKWYKETLDAAYDTYGLEFDYVSAVRNERKYDADWIKYLSAHLKSETGTPYDYSKIKLVAGEEVCTWGLADAMLKDDELRDAIDVLGSHYTSWSTRSAKTLARDYGKELWFSEASSPMNYADGTSRFEDTGSGMGGINGILDIANRFITMYPGGLMTLCEYQPAVAAYYDGVTYSHKQFILADTPWSGYYKLDSGFYMALHFSQFIDKGWAFIDDACFGDGKAGGDGHAIVDAVYSYLTATDTATGDYSTVITNTTDEPITYEFTVRNLAKAADTLNVWETRGPDGDDPRENYFRKIDTVSPEADGSDYKFSFTVKPYSIVTLSTRDAEERDTSDSRENALLELPYQDDFEYSDEFLAARGGAPLYTTDEGGAFEVEDTGSGKVLVQQITPEIKADEWGGTPEPTTNFGDDRWFNYSISADVIFAESDDAGSNYAGIGLRYSLGDLGVSGYNLRLYEDGSWVLAKNKPGRGLSGLASGTSELEGGKAGLKLEALDNNIKAYINGELAADITVSGEAICCAGRAALYSSYNRNAFDNIKLEPLDDPYITRLDNTDAGVSYSGSWEHEMMSSFKNYKRTISKGAEGSEVRLDFNGTGFAAAGLTDGDAVISVEIDGQTVEESYTVPSCTNREISYLCRGLEAGDHTAVLKVKQGSYSVDSFEICGSAVSSEEASAEESVSTETAEPSSAESADNSAKKGSGSRAGLIAAGAAAGIAAAACAVIALRKKRKD